MELLVWNYVWNYVWKYNNNSFTNDNKLCDIKESRIRQYLKSSHAQWNHQAITSLRPRRCRSFAGSQSGQRSSLWQ